MSDKKRLVVGISGASGSALGLFALRILHDLSDWESHLILTKSAITTMETELEMPVESVIGLADVVYPEEELGAAISSGSFATQGMLIAPCSMKTVAGIACGYTDNLLIRAADVTIKERRRLVLLAREAPLSSIHLRNLLTLSDLGAIILPPVPAFYQKPKNLDDVVQNIVGRALGYFGIEKGLYKPWQGLSDDSRTDLH